MKSDSECPDCGAQRESSPDGDYCPACYLLVGLEGIDAPIDESLDEIAEKAGDSIGRFELLEEIGEGGFGVVFRALQKAPVRRTLALKVIKPGMDSREIVARFEAERQALALMDHPHIAKVYDAGTTSLGRPFFVMELVEGLPLTTFCDKYKLCIRKRLELFTKICSGVQHAHQKGVIHRDLKPSNILVHYDDNEEPCPKIIDFGVAKAIGIELTEQTFFTLFGRMVGTPEYMSPEQAQLNALDVDTRSDIYSLGVVLHELLTGCVPLNRDQLTKKGYDEMRRMIRELEPPKSSTCFASLSQKRRERISESRQTDSLHLQRNLRHDLDWIVMKAIDKDRNRRYDTAQGLGADITRFLGGLPVTAGPPSRAYRVCKFILRHRTGAIISSLAALTLIGGIVAGVTAYRTQRKQLRETLILSARNHLAAKGEGWRSKALEDIKQAARIKVDDNLRNQALACLAGSDMEKQSLGLSLDDTESPVVFSPDHKLIAIARRRDRIEILDSSTKNPKHNPVSSSLPIENCQLTFAGDKNEYLVVASDPTSPEPRIEVIDLRTGEPSVPATALSNQAFDLLPNHQGLVIGQSNSIIFRDWNNQTLKDPIALGSPPISLSLNPIQDKLAVGFQSPSGNVREGKLAIFEYSSGQRLKMDRSGSEPWKISWSPSGKYLAMADAGNSLIVFEPGAIDPDHNLFGHSTKIQQITWSPDNRLLATATSSGREILLWDACHWQRLSTHGAFAGNFSFSRDGANLGPVSSGEGLFTLQIRNSKVCHHAVGHRGGGSIVASVWDTRVSEKSKDLRNDRYSLALATASNASVIIWDRQGKDLHQFENDITRPAGLAFSKSWFYMSGEEGIVRRGIAIEDKPPFGPFLKENITPCIMHFKKAEKFSDLDRCHQIAVSPDPEGRILIAASDSGIWLLDTRDGTKQRIEETQPDTHLDIDSSGRWFAIASGDPDPERSGSIRIYKLPEAEEKLSEVGEPIKVIDAGGITSLAFSEEMKDGRTLLAAGDSSNYRFWNSKKNWEEDHKLTHPNDMANSPTRMAFSPRGTALAISHSHDKLKVLDPRSMDSLIEPNFDEDEQWPLAISSDGGLIGTENHSNLFIWDFKAIREEFRELGIDWKNLNKFTNPRDMRWLIGVSVAPSPGKEGQ